MSNLTDGQLKTLRELLRQREATAQAEIRTEAVRRGDEPYAELAGAVTDVGDAATADLIVDTDNALMGMQLAELRDIAAARERIEHERYGICVDCKQDIDYDRLQAYPTAKRCVRCQGVHEHTFATAPHATF